MREEGVAASPLEVLLLRHITASCRGFILYLLLFLLLFLIFLLFFLLLFLYPLVP